MIPHADEIEALWQQSLAARREYAAHPSAFDHAHCAPFGCRVGLRRSNYMRRYRAERKNR